jgi:hypothetical protein
MELKPFARAGLHALAGTLFLFLIPIGLGYQFFAGSGGGTILTIAVLALSTVSAIVGGLFFWGAMIYLIAHSKERVAQREK